MKKQIKYIVELELHNNDKWFGQIEYNTLKEAKKHYQNSVNNCKNNSICKSMHEKIRLRKETNKILIMKEI